MQVAQTDEAVVIDIQCVERREDRIPRRALLLRRQRCGDELGVLDLSGAREVAHVEEMLDALCRQLRVRLLHRLVELLAGDRAATCLKPWEERERSAMV